MDGGIVVNHRDLPSWSRFRRLGLILEDLKEFVLIGHLSFRRCGSRSGASVLWNPDAEGCAAPRRRIHGEMSPEALGNNVEDDVQTEPGAAAITSRGEERIKGAQLDLLGHADPVVRDRNLDVVASDRPR